MRMPAETTPKIAVRNLTMAYGSFVVMHDLNFDITPRDIFVIMGGSGCGKSTLLRHLIGLREPAEGKVLFDGVDLHTQPPLVRVDKYK